MIEQSIKQKFNKNGYILIKKFLDENIVKHFLSESNIVVDKSTTGEWPFLSVYNDYCHFNNKINIFGSNFPLNNFFKTKLFELFNQYNFKKEILNLTDWEDFNTTLIRLHVFNKNYKYYGAWHRDDKIYPSPQSIQSVLYLKSESGFRIIPKNKVNELKKYSIKESGETFNESFSYKELPKDLYHVIEANAGDLLFFESGLLHQGICKKNRLHFHLRHEFKYLQNNNNNNNEMNFTEKFLPDYPFEEIEKIFPKYAINKNFFSKIKRIIRFIMYFFPRFKCIKNNFLKKGLLKENIFKNTFWQ